MTDVLKHIESLEVTELLKHLHYRHRDQFWKYEFKALHLFFTRTLLSRYFFYSDYYNVLLVEVLRLIFLGRKFLDTFITYIFLFISIFNDFNSLSLRALNLNIILKEIRVDIERELHTLYTIFIIILYRWR